MKLRNRHIALRGADLDRARLDIERWRLAALGLKPFSVREIEGACASLVWLMSRKPEAIAAMIDDDGNDEYKDDSAHLVSCDCWTGSAVLLTTSSKRNRHHEVADVPWRER